MSVHKYWKNIGMSAWIAPRSWIYIYHLVSGMAYWAHKCWPEIFVHCFTYSGNSLIKAVYILLMSLSVAQCIMRHNWQLWQKVICNSLGIDCIHSYVYGWSCQKYIKDVFSGVTQCLCASEIAWYMHRQWVIKPLSTAPIFTHTYV